MIFVIAFGRIEASGTLGRRRMFKYFPSNYPWNLSIMLSIEMGARMGEIAEMCAPLIEASKAPDAEGAAAFRKTWVDMADRLCALADEDIVRGRGISAGDKYLRASNYLLTAERLQVIRCAPGRVALYERVLDTFSRGLDLTHAAVERVEIPYGDSFLSALFVPARGVGGPQPVLVQVNGLDST